VLPDTAWGGTHRYGKVIETEREELEKEKELNRKQEM
jgi:hypothetical protein